MAPNVTDGKVEGKVALIREQAQPFNVVAVDPVNPNLVYAGSDTGLWRSLDGAATWQRVGLESGLPPATVHDIQINPVTKRTVIFTYGRGAYALVPSP